MSQWRYYEPCRENEEQARQHRYVPEGESLFFSRQLEYIRPRLYWVDYPALSGRVLVPMVAPKVGFIHDEIERMRSNPAPLLNHDRGDEDDASAREATITRNWPEFVKSRGGVCPVCRGFRTGREHFTRCKGMR